MKKRGAFRLFPHWKDVSTLKIRRIAEGLAPFSLLPVLSDWELKSLETWVEKNDVGNRKSGLNLLSIGTDLTSHL